MLEPAWRLAGPSEIIDAPDCLPECATERGRWYRCPEDGAYRSEAPGRLNQCPSCLLFVPRFWDCTCDLIQAETCDYCHGYPCRCP